MSALDELLNNKESIDKTLKNYALMLDAEQKAKIVQEVAQHKTLSKELVRTAQKIAVSAQKLVPIIDKVSSVTGKSAVKENATYVFGQDASHNKDIVRTIMSIRSSGMLMDENCLSFRGGVLVDGKMHLAINGLSVNKYLTRHNIVNEENVRAIKNMSDNLNHIKFCIEQLLPEEVQNAIDSLNREIKRSPYSIEIAVGDISQNKLTWEGFGRHFTAQPISETQFSIEEDGKSTIYEMDRWNDMVDKLKGAGYECIKQEPVHIQANGLENDEQWSGMEPSEWGEL